MIICLNWLPLALAAGSVMTYYTSEQAGCDAMRCGVYCEPTSRVGYRRRCRRDGRCDDTKACPGLLVPPRTPHEGEPDKKNERRPAVGQTDAELLCAKGLRGTNADSAEYAGNACCPKECGACGESACDDEVDVATKRKGTDGCCVGALRRAAKPCIFPSDVACSLPPYFASEPEKAAEAAVSYLVLADERQRPHIFAAQCTWLRRVPPSRVVYVTDFVVGFSVPEARAEAILAESKDKSEPETVAVGACGTGVVHRVRVPSVANYFDTLRRVVALKRIWSPWVCVVPAATGVHPQNLGAFLAEARRRNPGRRRNPWAKTPPYVGRMRNASEIPYSGHLPHVVPENGVVIRTDFLRAMARAPAREPLCTASASLRAADASVALVASCLWALGAYPKDASHVFRSTLESAQEPVAAGPLDTAGLLAFGARYASIKLSTAVELPAAGFETKSQVGGAFRAPPPVSSANVAFAIITPENAVRRVVVDVLGTWASQANVYFFIDEHAFLSVRAELERDIPELLGAARRLAQEPDGRGEPRQAIAAAGAQWRSRPRERHRRGFVAYGKDYTPEAAVVAEGTRVRCSANLAAGLFDVDRRRQDVRLVGLQLPPAPGPRPVGRKNRKRASASSNLARRDFYQTSLRKTSSWNLWLRAKVAHMVGWLSAKNPATLGLLADANATRTDWLVLMDDDTYVLPGRLRATLGWYGFAARSALAVGRKFHSRKTMLLGGGPGIALSRTALDKISAAECTKRTFPIISSSVPGGDGWLGSLRGNLKHWACLRSCLVDECCQSLLRTAQF